MGFVKIVGYRSKFVPYDNVQMHQKMSDADLALTHDRMTMMVLLLMIMVMIWMLRILGMMMMGERC